MTPLNEADARLIAAAPDLLEALKRIAAKRPVRLEGAGTGDTGHWLITYDVNGTARDGEQPDVIARTAIVKATGMYP